MIWIDRIELLFLCVSNVVTLLCLGVLLFDRKER